MKIDSARVYRPIYDETALVRAIPNYPRGYLIKPPMPFKLKCSDLRLLVNYYSHHIGDFNNATRHLSRTERSLYRDLIEIYYDTEGPIQASDFNRLARTLIARTDDEITSLKYILGEFFTLCDNSYTHSRCDREISIYRSKADRARINGRLGGRPKNPEKSGSKARITQPVNLANPEKSGSKANQEPITKNQEPLTRELKFAEAMFSEICKISPNTKKPVFKTWAKHLEKGARADNRNLEDLWRIFMWALNDDFWSANIRSPAKLIKQYDQLTAKRQSNEKGKRVGDGRTLAERIANPDWI